MQPVPADIGRQRQKLALADAGGAHHGEVVAPPLLRHADAHLAHPHHVLDVAEVALDLHCRKDQRPFLIDVARRAHVGRRDRVAAIRLMRLGQHGEMMRAGLVEHRHQQGMVGRMRAAVVGRVVQERIAPLQLRMEPLHRGAHQVRARQDMNGQAVGGSQQAVVPRDDAAGEVAGDVEHAGAAGPQQRVGHLLGHALQAVAENGEAGAVARPVRPVDHLRLLSTWPCIFRAP